MSNKSSAKTDAMRRQREEAFAARTPGARRPAPPTAAPTPADPGTKPAKKKIASRKKKPTR